MPLWRMAVNAAGSAKPNLNFGLAGVSLLVATMESYKQITTYRWVCKLGVAVFCPLHLWACAHALHGRRCGA